MEHQYISTSVLCPRAFRKPIHCWNVHSERLDSMRACVCVCPQFKKPRTLSKSANSVSSSNRGPESKKCFDLSSRFFIPGKQNCFDAILHRRTHIQEDTMDTTRGTRGREVRLTRDPIITGCEPYKPF